MKIWVTEIKALCPRTGELKTWCGDEVSAPTMELAQRFCDEIGKGYLRVIGELAAEIPCKEKTYEPDFEKMIDYEIIQNN